MQIELQRAKMGQYETLYSKGSRYQRLGGAQASDLNRKMISSKIAVLDRRIVDNNSRLNEAIAANDQIKDEIDDLRREKLIFQRIFARMEARLAGSRNKVSDHEKDIFAIGEQRMLLRSEAEEMKAELDRSKAEMKKQYAKLEELIAAGGPEQKEVTRGDLTLEEEKRLKHFINKAQWSIGKNKVILMSIDEKIRQHKKIWNEIQKGTGVENIEVLVTQFGEIEDRDFSRVRLANELSSEVEAMEKKIVQLRADARKAKVENDSRLSQRNDILSKLKQDIQSTQLQVEKNEKAIVASTQQLKTILEPIENLFHRIGCSKLLSGDGSLRKSTLFQASAAIREVMDSGVSLHTLPLCMGIIEQRAQELLQIHALCQRKETLPTSPKAVEAPSLAKLLAEQMKNLHMDEGEKKERKRSAGLIRSPERRRRREDESEETVVPLTKDALRSQVLAASDIRKLRNQIRVKTENPVAGKEPTTFDSFLEYKR